MLRTYSSPRMVTQALSTTLWAISIMHLLAILSKASKQRRSSTTERLAGSSKRFKSLSLVRGAWAPTMATRWPLGRTGTGSQVLRMITRCQLLRVPSLTGQEMCSTCTKLRDRRIQSVLRARRILSIFWISKCKAVWWPRTVSNSSKRDSSCTLKYSSSTSSCSPNCNEDLSICRFCHLTRLSGSNLRKFLKAAWERSR